LRSGDTENKTIVTALLADLVERGLDYSAGLLVVIDGAKALAAGVKSVFGDLALVQRCTLHKRRNVGDHLPKKDRDRVDWECQVFCVRGGVFGVSPFYSVLG
jgi:transposase-like protein